jgi:replicative DNA helicase
MSQLYHVELKGSVTETIHLHDEIVHQLDLSHILGEDDMKSLLRKQLEANDFQKDEEEDVWRKSMEDGVEVVFNLEDMQVSARLEEAQDVEKDVSAVGSAWDHKGQAKKAAEQELEHQKDRARQEIQRQSNEQQRELSQQLEAGEEERMLEINQMLQEVYAEALKEKAQSMGDVMEVHEGTSANGDYELVIKISQ